MRLMLVEPEATGHRMILYTRHILREARRRDWPVRLLTTERATHHPAFETVCREHGAELRVDFMPCHVDFPADQPTATALLKYQWRQYRSIAEGFAAATSSERPDMVYMVTLDYCDKIMALRGSPFGSVPFAGLLMAAGFHRRKVGIEAPRTRNDTLYEWAFKRVLRMDSLRTMVVIDATLLAYARTSYDVAAQKLRYVPDAAAVALGTETRAQARAALGIASDQVVVLLYGSVSRRKGVGELLAALQRPEVPVNTVALIAGQEDADTQALIRQEGAALRDAGRLILMPGFLDDLAEHRAFSAADIVWLNYQHFYGMSGVLIQAGARGLPVVACREGLIGWVTQEHGLGERVYAASVADAAASLRRLATDSKLRTALGENGRRHAARHSTEAFGAAVCDAIEMAAGRDLVE